MSAQAPGQPLHPAVKVLAGLLVLCTLTALWVTAVRVKANKMAARYGVGAETDPLEARLPPIRLHRGQSAPVQHLSLTFSEEGLEVRDAQGRTRALYVDLIQGLRLGWQELRMTLREASKDDLVIEPEFIPGAPSFGAGVYLDLRSGLRVEVPHGRALTLIAWDPVKQEGKVRIEDASRSDEYPITGTSPAMRLRWSLTKGPGLKLEDLE
jgi:hypothetical protein